MRVSQVKGLTQAQVESSLTSQGLSEDKVAGLASKRNKKFLLDIKNDSYLQNLSNIDTTLSSGTHYYDILNNAWKFTRVGVDNTVLFNDYNHELSSSSGVQTIYIRAKGTVKNSSCWIYPIYIDASNNVSLAWGASTLSINAESGGTTTSKTVAIAGVDILNYVWFKIIMTNVSSILASYSEEDVNTPEEVATWTDIDVQITTNIPTGIGKLQHGILGNNQSIYTRWVSYE